MSLVHRTCFDVYQRRPFFSTAIQSNWIAIKPIERIIIPAFELIYMYFISRIWKNKSVNFCMCMSQKKWEKKSDFQFRCQSRKHLKFMMTVFSYIFMLACPNEQFIKYMVGCSCILVFFVMNLHCILCLILQVRKISHPNNTCHPMSMPCRLNVLSQIS